MHKYIILAFVFLISLFSISSLQAGFFDRFIDNWAPSIRYCDEDQDCGIEAGIDQVKAGINGLETERSASEYIQDVVLYLLSFVSLLAILYIIYAGFNILTGNGDEEKLKSSKTTVIYVILGIALMWLAWPITRFIFTMLWA